MHPPLPSPAAAEAGARVWRTAALQVERVDVPAGIRLRGHGHAEPHLCFVLAGAFDERDGAARHRYAAAGTLRGSPAGDAHDLTFRAPSRCLLVLFERGAAGSDAPAPATRRWIADAESQRVACELAARLVDAYASPLEVELLGHELMAAALAGGRVRARGAAWLARVRERIADAPASPPDTHELAREAGLHPVYVARAFRTAYGIGIGEFARVARAERARRLLADGAHPLAELAVLAGYSDQSHLSRDMRRYLGATPAEVRRGAGRIVEVSGVQDAEPASVAS